MTTTTLAWRKHSPRDGSLIALYVHDRFLPSTLSTAADIKVALTLPTGADLARLIGEVCRKRRPTVPDNFGEGDRSRHARLCLAAQRRGEGLCDTNSPDPGADVGHPLLRCTATVRFGRVWACHGLG